MNSRRQNKTVEQEFPWKTWEKIYCIFDRKMTILAIYIGSWPLGTAQLGKVFGNSGQCLGKKLGNFYF